MPETLTLPPAMMHPAELNRRMQMIRMTGRPIGRSSRSTRTRADAIRKNEDIPDDWRLSLHRRGNAAVVMIDGPIWFDQEMALWMGGTASIDLIDVLDEAASDDTIETVVLDIDSPGGSVAGSHDVISAVMRCVESKPTVALCHDMACSMAYWIAAMCPRIYGTPSCETGSIGTIATWYDTTASAEKHGERAIPLTSGAEFKSMGQYGVTITDEMVAAEQAIIDAMGKDFRDAVVANRPIDEASLLAMRGAAYYGPSQVEMGLIDEVIGSHEFYARLLNGTLETTAIASTPEGPKNTPETESKPPHTTGPAAANERTALMDDTLKEQISSMTDEEKTELKAFLTEEEEPEATDPETEEEPTAVVDEPKKDEDEPSAMTISQAKAFLKECEITDEHTVNALAIDAVEKGQDRVALLRSALKAQKAIDPEIAATAQGSDQPIGGNRGGGGGSGGGDATAQYHAKVKETMETFQLSKPKATAKVNREHPELNAAFIKAANLGRVG